MRSSKDKKEQPIRIAAPAMEAQCNSQQSLQELLEREEIIADLHFNKLVEESFDSPYCTIRNCTFTGVTWSACELKSAQLSDVRFENCDLSNCSFAASSLHRVEFIGCKLVGTDLSATTLNHVSIRQGSGLYINLSMSKMNQVSFQGCDFRNGTFNDCRFTAVELPDTILIDSDFSHSSLRGIDLRTARISGIVLSPADLRGTIVSSLQAMELLPLLGVIISD